MKLRTSQALDRGLSLMLSGRLEEAKKIYQTILKSDPNHAEANHKMGLISLFVLKRKSFRHFKAKETCTLDSLLR